MDARVNARYRDVDESNVAVDPAAYAQRPHLWERMVLRSPFREDHHAPSARQLRLIDRVELDRRCMFRVRHR